MIIHLNRGRKIRHFPGLQDGERADQVHFFFCDLKSFYTGCMENPDSRYAVERTAFDINFTRLPILGEIAVTYRCNNR